MATKVYAVNDIALPSIVGARDIWTRPTVHESVNMLAVDLGLISMLFDKLIGPRFPYLKLTSAEGLYLLPVNTVII